MLISYRSDLRTSGKTTTRLPVRNSSTSDYSWSLDAMEIASSTRFFAEDELDFLVDRLTLESYRCTFKCRIIHALNLTAFKWCQESTLHVVHCT